ncbi:hypothetical protein J4210_01940 [Candidatus Woesearchaeota archaeon]|nr:hypothetical protein [Candidatus Woesearchaeota archaeon]
MVVEQLSNVLYLTTVSLALLTAVSGLFMLNQLFKNKIKDLFTDKTFFIYFSLVIGYSLYALGELTYYLIFTVYDEVPPASMPDVYWTLGAATLILSFFAFAWTFHKMHRESSKLVMMAVGGVVLFGAVLLYLLQSDLAKLATSQGHLFVSFFYPLADCLIITFGSIIPLYYSKIENFRSSLLMLFITSVGILIADLLYISSTAGLEIDASGILHNIFYSSAYLLAALGFITMIFSARRKMSA